MKNIEKYIDHTLLKPDATEAAIGKVCAEAIEHGFKSVCVNPARIAFAAKQLEGTGVLPCCVVGFPLGATFSKVKAFEAETAIANGAKEVDMVINISKVAVKQGVQPLPHTVHAVRPPGDQRHIHIAVALLC